MATIKHETRVCHAHSNFL